MTIKNAAAAMAAATIAAAAALTLAKPKRSIIRPPTIALSPIPELAPEIFREAPNNLLPEYAERSFQGLIDIKAEQAVRSGYFHTEEYNNLFDS